MSEWLPGGFENFVETAAFIRGSWDLCDDPTFQEHCKKCFDEGMSPDNAAFSFKESAVLGSILPRP